MYLSTLRDYIKVLAGELERVVHLPSHKTVTLNELSTRSERRLVAGNSIAGD